MVVTSKLLRNIQEVAATDIFTEDPMDGVSVKLLSVAPFDSETGPFRVQDHRQTRGVGYFELCRTSICLAFSERFLRLS